MKIFISWSFACKILCFSYPKSHSLWEVATRTLLVLNLPIRNSLIVHSAAQLFQGSLARIIAFGWGIWTYFSDSSRTNRFFFFFFWDWNKVPLCNFPWDSLVSWCSVFYMLECPCGCLNSMTTKLNGVGVQFKMIECGGRHDLKQWTVMFHGLHHPFITFSITKEWKLFCLLVFWKVICIEMWSFSPAIYL